MPFPRVCLSFCVVGEAESPEWKWLGFGIFIVNNQTNILKPHAVLSRFHFFCIFKSCNISDACDIQ